MPSMFYAVAEGRVPGIYKSSKECKEQTKNYTGAVFKAFRTEKQAEDFMEQHGQKVDKAAVKPVAKIPAKSKKKAAPAVPEKVVNPTIATGEYKRPKTCFACVRGAYNPETGVYGYGLIIADNDETVKENQGYGSKVSSVPKTTGEIEGVKKALNLAMDMGFKHFTLCYTNPLIEKWLCDERETKTSESQSLVSLYIVAQQIMDITLMKIPDDSDDAARLKDLAEDACGLIELKRVNSDGEEDISYDLAAEDNDNMKVRSAFVLTDKATGKRLLPDDNLFALYYRCTDGIGMYTNVRIASISYDGIMIEADNTGGKRVKVRLPIGSVDSWE